MAESSFFMVYREGGASPTHRHTTEESAKQEAERIARESKARTFVLKAIACCVVKDVNWSELAEAGEIPF